MLITHSEQLRDLVDAQPACEANAPVVAAVLDADPAIHGVRGAGKTRAKQRSARTYGRDSSAHARPATASGWTVSSRQASRGRHSQHFESDTFPITTDSDRNGHALEPHAVLCKSVRGSTFALNQQRLKSIGCNTLENPC